MSSCCKTLRKMPFSIEDKHTIKLLREQKLYWATKILRMFLNKNWTLSEVKIVLSKIDATGRVGRCSGSGWPRTARSPDTISDVQDLVLSGSEPRRLRGVGGFYKSVCTSTTGSRTWKSYTSVSRRNGTVRTRQWLTTRSVNGASDWQPALQPAEDILNIHSERHCICSHTDYHVLNLVNFAEFRVKQINFACTNNSLVVIVNFRFSQGSVAT